MVGSFPLGPGQGADVTSPTDTTFAVLNLGPGAIAVTVNGLSTTLAAGELQTFVFPPNTPTGTDVCVNLNGGLEVVGGMRVCFSTVTSAGDTTVDVTTTGPPPPTGFKIVGIAGAPAYFDVNTAASFTAPIDVCIHYDEAEAANEKQLKLKHRQPQPSGFEDITNPTPPDNPDTANDIICGTSDTLSLFAMMVPLGVGGTTELLIDGSDSAARRTDSSGPSSPPYTAIAGVVTAAALAACTWYVRKRWLR